MVGAGPHGSGARWPSDSEDRRIAPGRDRFNIGEYKQKKTDTQRRIYSTSRGYTRVSYHEAVKVGVTIARRWSICDRSVYPPLTDSTACD